MDDNERIDLMVQKMVKLSPTGPEFVREYLQFLLDQIKDKTSFDADLQPEKDQADQSLADNIASLQAELDEKTALATQKGVDVGAGVKTP